MTLPRRSHIKTGVSKRTPRGFFRPTVLYPEWEKVFLREPMARECLDRILASCGDSSAPRSSAVIRQQLRENILEFLYGYWGLSDTRAQRAARKLLMLIKSLPQIEKEARSLADKVENLHGSEQLMIKYPYWDLTGNLRVYAEHLKQLRASLKGHNRKLGPRNINESIELAKLIFYVITMTGGAHFADLATLMSCSLNAHKCPPGVSAPDADALRHLYDRFNFRNPGLLEAIKYADLH